MKINKEDLLKELQIVLPGLSQREIIEQSSCFVFKDKKIYTYNDEIACCFPSCLHIEGAIKASTFLSILQKLNEIFLEVEIQNGELVLIGNKKKRKAGIRMEKEILLPIDCVETPENWKPLPISFTDAINMVQYCAGKDETQFNITCIHLTPNYVETCDNYQICRYDIKLPLNGNILVRRNSLSQMISLDMNEFCETDSWIHFRNPLGLIYSCRKYIEDYPSEEITEHLQTIGIQIKLPEGLKKAVERASVFSVENVEDNYVVINLSKGMLRVTGQGVSGWFKEIKKLQYNGQDMDFAISPALLVDLCKKYNECEICSDKLKVKGNHFTYLTVLNPVQK